MLVPFFFCFCFPKLFSAVFHDNSPNGSIQLCMLGENKYYLLLLIQSGPDSQTAPHHRLVIPEEVIMQSRFRVGVLVLQAEGLVCAICYVGFLLQMTPAGVVAEPQEVSVFIGHLSLDADLVAVEVVGLLRYQVPSTHSI